MTTRARLGFHSFSRWTALASESMIDLHCHILPGIDDGSPDLGTSLDMARKALADGIRVIACTPHIYPGLYENTGPDICRAVEVLQGALDEEGIGLQLSYGADTHLTPDLLEGLKSGRIPSLGGTRYFLLEPPHHVAPPRFEEFVFNVLTAGYLPVITHPERLTWVEDHYEVFVRLVGAGAWMQVTAGSLTGRFGQRTRYWAERFIDDGIVHILATDAHGVDRRPPLLAEGRDVAVRRLGEDEAENLVEIRPRGILAGLEPGRMPPIPGNGDSGSVRRPRRGGWLSRLFKG